MRKIKQVFRDKKLVGLPSQLKLLAAFSRKSRHDHMSEQCNHICLYRMNKHTQFHSGMGTQAQAGCAYIFLSLNPSSFRVVLNNLASHAHVIHCISAFQDVNTIKNAVTHTHTHTGRRDTVAGV